MVALLMTQPLQAQTSPNAVPVGRGSYTLTLPEGAAAPPERIYRTENVTGPMPTHKWWSSLAWQPGSAALYAHPLTLQATAAGLRFGYSDTPVISGDGRRYSYPLFIDLEIRAAQSADALVDAYSDWTVTAVWGDDLRATFGLGLPFVYVTTGSGANIRYRREVEIISDGGNALHIRTNGHDYGLFAPSGAVWTIDHDSQTLTSDLNGRDYFSVALLPNNRPATFDLFRAHAFAFVTDTRVEWTFDQDAATLLTDYHVTTNVMEGDENRPLLALYRHQYLHTDAVNTDYEYVSPRGPLRLLLGDHFQTRMTYHGVLPALPNLIEQAVLHELIEAEFQRSNIIKLPGPGGAYDSYWTGKGLGRVANLLLLADQAGHEAARERFLSELKTALERWLTAGRLQPVDGQFYYDSNWGTLIGYPAGFGSDTALNDHHFHYGYFVFAAAVVALYDAEWAARDNWGGMIELLIGDANSPQTTALFPRLRSFEPYAGHSWANGDGNNPDGNNQESSSEAINFAVGLILWGEATGNQPVRDLGIYLYTTEVAAVQQYWFDVDDVVFPPQFQHETVAIVWGSGGLYNTWWTPSIVEAHGINFLPITGGSLYLGHRPDYAQRNYAHLLAENGQPETVWQDIIWSFVALHDAQTALDRLETTHYTEEWGESKAHTYHWIHNLATLGQVSTAVTADTPLYAVFTQDQQTTYAAYNASDQPLLVTFSDGTQLETAPKSLGVLRR